MNIITEIIESIFPKPRNKKLMFPGRTLEKMKKFNVSEKDVADVFYHGEQIGEAMIVRKYNGYEIGLFYITDRKTGDYVITAVWKRDRR